MNVKIDGEYVDGVMSATLLVASDPDELPVWAVELIARDANGKSISCNGSLLFNLIHSTNVEVS